jgi:uncharacterized protein (DUF4415 family)
LGMAHRRGIAAERSAMPRRSIGKPEPFASAARAKTSLIEGSTNRPARGPETASDMIAAARRGMFEAYLEVAGQQYVGWTKYFAELMSEIQTPTFARPEVPPQGELECDLVQQLESFEDHIDAIVTRSLSVFGARRAVRKMFGSTGERLLPARLRVVSANWQQPPKALKDLVRIRAAERVIDVCTAAGEGWPTPTDLALTAIAAGIDEPVGDDGSPKRRTALWAHTLKTVGSYQQPRARRTSVRARKR